MPKIEIDKARRIEGSGYPPPLDQPCNDQCAHQLGDVAGLSQFGVNLTRLSPGAWTSQRHWHTHEDEFVWILEGEVVLVEDAGETVLCAGDCAGWKAAVADGHHLQNRSGREAVILEIGSRFPDVDGCDYPDLDMVAKPREDFYRHRDGSPYPKKAR